MRSGRHGGRFRACGVSIPRPTLPPRGIIGDSSAQTEGIGPSWPKVSDEGAGLPTSSKAVRETVAVSRCVQGVLCILIHGKGFRM